MQRPERKQTIEASYAAVKTLVLKGSAAYDAYYAFNTCQRSTCYNAADATRNTCFCWDLDRLARVMSVRPNRESPICRNIWRPRQNAVMRRRLRLRWRTLAVTNAHTSREGTAYYLRLLPEHLSLGVDILADILTESTLPEIEIERERGVIIQEIGQSFDTPDDHVFDLYAKSAYFDHTLGRPIWERSTLSPTLVVVISTDS